MARTPAKKTKTAAKRPAKTAQRKASPRKAAARPVPAGDESSTSVLSGTTQDLIRDAFLNRP